MRRAQPLSARITSGIHLSAKWHNRARTLYWRTNVRCTQECMRGSLPLCRLGPI